MTDDHSERFPGKRRMAAVMAADVAGYSRLMGDDEEATIAALGRAREVFREATASHDGRIVDTAGDSVLAIFESVIQATRCALAVQEQLATHNAEVAKHRRMQFRIGIHFGDIVEQQDGTIYGDGVNVAARLESLAEPGGLTVSGTVHEHIDGRLGASLVDLGDQEVKNIARPVRVWRVGAGGQEQQTTPRFSNGLRRYGLLAALAVLLVAGITAFQTDVLEISETAGDPLLAIPEGPAIAVLPFENLSEDQTQEYFADGLAADILTQLSFVSNYRILGRASTFKYKGEDFDVRGIGESLGADFVLQGSVRTAEDQVRINAELHDVRDGRQVWAKTYDRVLNAGNVFAVQDEVTHNVVMTIADGYGVIPDYWNTERGEQPVVNLSSWECVNLGFEYFESAVADRHLRARDCLELAVVRDPKYGDAWGWLAIIYAHEVAFGYNPLPNSLDRALQAGMRGIDVAPNNQMAWEGLAAAHWFRHSFENFDAAAQTAIGLNPNDASTLANIGLYYGLSGHFDKALPLMEKAMVLSPYHQNWYYAPHYFEALDRGDYARALEMANKGFTPGVHWAFMFRAVAFAKLGQLENAQDDVRELLKLFPQYPAFFWQLGYAWNYPTHRLENLAEALNRAGAGIPSKPELDS